MQTILNEISTNEASWKLGDFEFSISRPHRFGIVIHGVASDSCGELTDDYLHRILLTPANRAAFFELIDSVGLVVCKNVKTDAASYRKVRGKSSSGKLSQAEYYHHDGCSCPTKPRLVEIRMPQQTVPRNVATAIAPFPAVLRAMFLSLPERLRVDDEAERLRQDLARAADDGWRDVLPEVEQWDRLQGQLTRLVRKEMTAEACRSFFRDVDRIAEAYDLPWEMGESRLMLNHSNNLANTMQHRRAYQTVRSSDEKNGSLVKRWTAEET